MTIIFYLLQLFRCGSVKRTFAKNSSHVRRTCTTFVQCPRIRAISLSGRYLGGPESCGMSFNESSIKVYPFGTLRIVSICRLSTYFENCLEKSIRSVGHCFERAAVTRLVQMTRKTVLHSLRVGNVCAS